MGAYYPASPAELLVTNGTYTTLLDEVSPTITYIGKATPGSATSAAVWKVSRLTTSGNDLSVEFAGGGDFSQIWDNRAALSYS